MTSLDQDNRQIRESLSQFPASPSLAPASPSRAPASPSRAPASPSLAPASLSRAPASPSRAPASPSRAPASPSRAPASPSLASGSSSCAPTTSLLVPTNPSCTRDSPSCAPASSSRVPASSSRAPASASRGTSSSSRGTPSSSRASSNSSRASSSSSRGTPSSSRASSNSSRASSSSSRASSNSSRGTPSSSRGTSSSSRASSNSSRGTSSSSRASSNSSRGTSSSSRAPTSSSRASASQSRAPASPSRAPASPSLASASQSRDPASASRAPTSSSRASASQSCARDSPSRAPSSSSRAPSSSLHGTASSSRVPSKSSRASSNSSRDTSISSRAPVTSSHAPSCSSRASASLSYTTTSSKLDNTGNISRSTSRKSSRSPKRDNRGRSLRNESVMSSVRLSSTSRKRSAAEVGEARGRESHSPYSNNDQRELETPAKHSAKRPRYSPDVNKEPNPRQNSPRLSSMRHPDERRKGESGKNTHVGNRKRKNDANRYDEGRKVKRTVNTNSVDNPSPREREVKPISYTALKIICDITDNDEAMLKISKMVERYTVLLNSTEEIREGLFKLIIDSLVKIVKSTNRPTQVMCILLQTHQTFLRAHLTPFILKLSDKKELNLEELILKLVTIMEFMLQRIPAEIVYSVPIFQLMGVATQFHTEGLVKENVKDRIKKAIDLWEDVKKRISNKGVNEKPPNDFRELSVVPDYKDFQSGTKPFLRANVIDNAYNDVEHYLDVQFRLLREDLIIPLRDGVKQLRRERKMLEKGSQGGQETTKKRRQVFVYQDVKILNPVCNCKGGVYRIRINISHPALKRVRWEKSKRLKFGALVCLSPDSFQMLYFGAVEEREPADLKYGEIQIRFDNCNVQMMRHFIENKRSFQMVESESYFEAYRHNLSALQKLTDENLPFKEYVVFGNKDVLPPKYLLLDDAEKEPNEEEGERENFAHQESLSTNKETEIEKDDGDLSEGELDPRTVYFDLKTICDPQFLEDIDQNMSHVPVLDCDQWPSKEALGLDDSQYQALQLALTSRFALIQGPPGTGKTHVGLKIAHALLDNRDLWSGEDRSPILMVSYTNHALDQFLMGLTNKKGIVRVGGRSREEALYELNLKVLRRKTRLENRNLLPFQEQEGIRLNIKAIESNYSPNEAASLLAQSDKAVLSVKKLEKFMKPEHFEALKPLDSKYTYFQMDQMLLRWLEVEVHSQDQTRKQKDEYFQMSSSKEYIDEDDAVFDTDEGKSIVACYIDNAVAPDKLRNCLENTYIMNERREIEIDDICNLRLDERWRLYRLWRDRLENECHKRILDSQDAGYETELKKLQESNDDVDLMVFQNSRVIGMTTTCAARFHSLLQRVKPKIVIVEEAAEVLEAHILTSLPLDCEHVILIGDHQQLRPSCTVYDLAKKYNLNISMFERLVKLRMPCVRLSEQHRMRPEIASLMKHIYEDLQDHPSVKEYDNMRGVEHNVFFIDHRHQEDNSEDSFSHLNEHEAQFVVRLCRYIVQQGYTASQITILAPYLGQMFKIKDCMTPGDDDLRKQTRLTTIDNYQGEENDIILLSLVRSNDTGHVGFVNDINRACVALSRARMGLYVIGNFELLTSKSDIWKKVVDDLKKRGQFGEELPLKCQSHDSKILVKEPKDFQEKVPCGGCDVPCLCRLDCGHTCTLSCHPYDKKHEEFKCLERCVRTIIGCENRHQCEKECWERCDSDCSYLVAKLLLCGHTKEKARCSVSIQRLRCDVRCEEKLECGHQCQARCSESCTTACQELVKRSDWPCGHEVTIACSATPFDCPGPCGIPSCGHECSGHCGECLQGRVHRRCTKTCGRVLVCGHECRAKCTITCPPCTNKCETKCQHSECRRTCGEPCVPCSHQCEWQCRHLKCTMKCGEICDRSRCNKPCYKIIEECGHKCRGLCKETCVCVKCHKDDIQEIFGTEDFEDQSVRFLRLIDCKHIFEVGGIDQWVDTENSGSEENTAVQMKTCPICKKAIRTTLRYNSVIKKHMKDVEKVKKVILADQPTVYRRRQELIKKIRSYVKDDRPSTAEVRHKRICEFLEKCIQKCETSFELTNLENQVKLLERCKRVLGKSKMTPRENLSTTGTIRTNVFSTLNYLKQERIIGSNAERELRDIHLEISRQSLRLQACSLVEEAEALSITFDPEEQEHVDKIQSKLSQISKIEDEDLEENFKKIREIRSKYRMDPPTREEKDQIIKAMELSKGHWYKCRKGHVYAIGECGGAMETGTCPECHDDIGGTSHKLVDGNDVATEMDGARHSAWSEQANMGNYNLQDLQD